MQKRCLVKLGEVITRNDAKDRESHAEVARNNAGQQMEKM